MIQIIGGTIVAILFFLSARKVGKNPIGWALLGALIFFAPSIPLFIIWKLAILPAIPSNLGGMSQIVIVVLLGLSSVIPSLGTGTALTVWIYRRNLRMSTYPSETPSPASAAVARNVIKKIGLAVWIVAVCAIIYRYAIPWLDTVISDPLFHYFVAKQSFGSAVLANVVVGSAPHAFISGFFLGLLIAAPVLNCSVTLATCVGYALSLFYILSRMTLSGSTENLTTEMLIIAASFFLLFLLASMVGGIVASKTRTILGK
jgi:hypothetical protein